MNHHLLVADLENALQHARLNLLPQVAMADQETMILMMKKVLELVLEILDLVLDLGRLFIYYYY